MEKAYNRQIEVDAYYTVDDLRRIFRCGRDKAYQIASLIGFPAMNMGGRILILPGALANWMEKNQHSDFSVETLKSKRFRQDKV